MVLEPLLIPLGQPVTKNLRQQVVAAQRVKVKRTHHVALEWTSTAEVDVYRNGLRLQTGRAGATWTDVIGSKGRGSYDYWVCETGTAICYESLSFNF
ncbi:MAG: hypothetical protein ACO3KY_05340 [Lysobacterales bacterium]